MLNHCSAEKSKTEKAEILSLLSRVLQCSQNNTIVIIVSFIWLRIIFWRDWVEQDNQTKNKSRRSNRNTSTDKRTQTHKMVFEQYVVCIPLSFSITVNLIVGSDYFLSLKKVMLLYTYSIVKRKNNNNNFLFKISVFRFVSTFVKVQGQEKWILISWLLPLSWEEYLLYWGENELSTHTCHTF